MGAFLDLTGRQLPQLLTLIAALIGLGGLLFALWASRWNGMIMLFVTGLAIVYAVNAAFYIHILFAYPTAPIMPGGDLSAIRSLVNVLSLLPYSFILAVAMWRQRRRNG